MSLSESDDESSEHDRVLKLLVEVNYLKDEQKQAAQLRIENDELKRKMKELEEQVKRESLLRVENDEFKRIIRQKQDIIWKRKYFQNVPVIMFDFFHHMNNA